MMSPDLSTRQNLATDFIFVQQPSFDNSYELLKRFENVLFKPASPQNSYSGHEFQNLCKEDDVVRKIQVQYRLLWK